MTQERRREISEFIEKYEGMDIIYLLDAFSRHEQIKELDNHYEDFVKKDQPDLPLRMRFLEMVHNYLKMQKIDKAHKQ